MIPTITREQRVHDYILAIMAFAYKYRVFTMQDAYHHLNLMDIPMYEAFTQLVEKGYLMGDDKSKVFHPYHTDYVYVLID